LNNDIGKLKTKYESYQETFEKMSTKYEGAIKEKMLMKLEKDRLIAKVDNLEANLAQIKEDGGPGPQGAGLGDESQIDLKSSPTKTHVSSQMG
jgi:sperm-associated antigen 16 protein